MDYSRFASTDFSPPAASEDEAFSPFVDEDASGYEDASRYAESESRDDEQWLESPFISAEAEDRPDVALGEADEERESDGAVRYASDTFGEAETDESELEWQAPEPETIDEDASEGEVDFPEPQREFLVTESTAWSETEIPDSVFSHEDTEDAGESFEYEESGAALGRGLSPLARRGRMHKGHGERRSPWREQVYGLVVHTTGGSLPGKARKKGQSPDEFAAAYYAGSGGTHYVNGWKGIDGNQLHQVMNERQTAWGVGKVKEHPELDQWRSCDAGRFEKDLPPTVLRLWRARWPGVKDSLTLLPVRSSANLTYVHVECTPCVYYRDGDKEQINDPDFKPMRPGLRFTQAQHETVARLAWDIAQRHGWPKGVAWWKTPRLLGHEDITPLSRHDKNGGWDPGALRDAPFFDWQFVYDYLTRLSGGTAAAPAAAGSGPGGLSSVGSLLGSLADRFRQLIAAGQLVAAITEAVAGGQTDLNKLANLVFFAKHPELGGRPIRPDERELAAEWLHIRDNVVAPLLARLKPSTSATPGVSSPSSNVSISSDVATGRLGTLTVTSPDQYRFSYQITDDDAAWIARLLTGEAGGRNDVDNVAVIWAVLNRFALFTHAGSYWMRKAGLKGYPTLASFVRAYSTTLQPVLNSRAAAERAIKIAAASGGKDTYVKTGGTYDGTNIPKGQLKRHLDHIQKLSWSRLPQATRAVVTAVLTGRVPSPIGLASEFANTATYYKQRHGRLPNDAEWLAFTRAHAQGKKWTWVGEIANLHQYRSNAFFVDNRAKGLPERTVRVV